MKKIILTIVAILTTVINVSAMSYDQARDQALFLTDKMAYELNLNQQQYEAAYEINLDYLMGVTTADDVYAYGWTQRNRDLQYIMYDWQYTAFCAASYFFRPLYWNAGYWEFGVYAHYPHREFFYFSRPACYVTYRGGGHTWRSNGGVSWYGSRVHIYHTVTVRDAHRGMRDIHHGSTYHDRGYRSGSSYNRGSSHESGRGSYNHGSYSTQRTGSGTSYNRDANRGSSYNRDANHGTSYNREGSGTTYNRGSYSRESSTRESYNRSYNPTTTQRQSSSYTGRSSVGRSYSGSSMGRTSGSTSGTTRSSGFGASHGSSHSSAASRPSGMSGSHGGRR